MQRLEREGRRWLKPHPYRVYSELDAEGRNKLIKVEILRDPPAELGLIIGDCLHNLRSALDNLAYDLARSHRGVPLSKSVARESQFPIFKDCDQFLDKGMDQIRGIAPVCKTIIKGLQPYYRGEKFAYHRLWMLRELSNSDKHRVLHPTLLLPQAASMFVGDSDISDIRFNWGTIEEDGAVIAWYPYSGEANPEMNMHPHFTFGVGFRQGMPLPILPPDILNTMSAVNVLWWIHNYVVRQVVSPLRLFLRHNPPRASTVKG